MNTTFLPKVLCTRRVLSAILACLASCAIAEGPPWWTNRNVLVSGVATNDFAPVNMGQLKWIATNACAELTGLPGGAGSNIASVLANWLPDGTNWTPVNVGQLKHIGSLFYDRFIDEGYATNYPWINDPAASDYAPANMGQVKYMFSFDPARDTDGDGFPDMWETTQGLCPTNTDSDNDGCSDGDEVALGTDPTNPASRLYVHYVNVAGTNPIAPYWQWKHAATNIQDAVEVVRDGDTVLVTNGVYETGGIEQYGYYLISRVAVTNAIVLRSVNGPEHTSIVGGGVWPMGRCVSLASGSSMIGFTMTNGGAFVSWDDGCGGGVRCEPGALVSNCVVVKCSADDGGGVYGGTVANCVISGNDARRGGGVSESAVIQNSTLAGNWAEYGGGAYSSVVWNCSIDNNSGGGVYGCTVQNCLISRNSAGMGQGGGACASTLWNSTVASNTAICGGGAFGSDLQNCRIMGNTAMYGGGAYESALQRCTIAGNSGNQEGGGLYGGTAENCIISGNASWIAGGASSSTVWNCTITGNTGMWGGGGTYGGTSENCIVYYNTGYYFASNMYGGVSRHCCTTPLDDGEGNISHEPAFVDSAHGDYRLQPWSPCIDAGMANDVTRDIEGTMRPLDGTGNGVAQPDMGAYEYSPLMYVIPTGCTHYVATTGTPQAPYTNWATAAATIQQAADAASAGDVVLVAAGTYSTGGATGPGSLMCRVAITQAVQIVSLGGREVTSIVGAPSVRCAYVGNGAKLVGFTLANGNAQGSESTDQYGGGVLCGANGEVAWCRIAYNLAQYGGGGSGGLLSNCLIVSNTAATSGGGVYRSDVRNSILARNSGQCGGGSYESTLVNCTVVSNTAMTNGGGAWSGDITNTILYYNVAGVTASNFGGSGSVSYSCLTPNPGGLANITTAPGFEDVVAANYHLTPASPCRDAGTNIWPQTAAYDMDHESRLFGSRTDIGADEYVDMNANVTPDWWETQQRESRSAMTTPIEMWVDQISSNSVTIAFTNLYRFYNPTSITYSCSYKGQPYSIPANNFLVISAPSENSSNTVTVIRYVDGSRTVTGTVSWVQISGYNSLIVVPYIPLGRATSGTVASKSFTIPFEASWDRVYLSGTASQATPWRLPVGCALDVVMSTDSEYWGSVTYRVQAPSMLCSDLTASLLDFKYSGSSLHLTFNVVHEGANGESGVPAGPFYLLRWSPHLERVSR